jgi:DNA-binding HxlR family transcriptional regulator
MTRPTIAPSELLAINAVLVSSRQAGETLFDRWSLVLVLAMLQGESRFNGLAERTGMATRLLTTRLKALDELGILVRMPYSLRPLRHEYRLTNMGEEISDVIFQMHRWEQNWYGSAPPSGGFVHRPCGAHLRPQLRCAACGIAATARDIELRLSRTQLKKMPEKQTVHRRSTIASADTTATRHLLGPSLDVFGDKWGIEIILCAFFRIRRFNDFRLCTGISANILTDRLERLVGSGVMERGRDQSSQGGYFLTEKGVDLYGVLVSRERWADTWLRARYHSPVRLIHRACGQVFRPLTTCTSCERALVRADVEFLAAPRQYVHASAKPVVGPLVEHIVTA